MTRRTSTGKIFIRTEREILRRLALGWELTYRWVPHGFGSGYSLTNPKNPSSYHGSNYFINLHALNRLRKKQLVSTEHDSLTTRYYITKKGRRYLQGGRAK